MKIYFDTYIEQIKGLMFMKKEVLKGNQYIFRFKKPRQNFIIHTIFCEKLRIKYYYDDILIGDIILEPYTYHKQYLPTTKIIEELYE